MQKIVKKDRKKRRKKDLSIGQQQGFVILKTWTLFLAKYLVLLFVLLFQNCDIVQVDLSHPDDASFVTM